MIFPLFGHLLASNIKVQDVEDETWNSANIRCVLVYTLYNRIYRALSGLCINRIGSIKIHRIRMCSRRKEKFRRWKNNKKHNHSRTAIKSSSSPHLIKQNYLFILFIWIVVEGWWWWWCMLMAVGILEGFAIQPRVCIVWNL